MIRLLSVGFGKVKVTKCYTYLLLWLILVSIGLYWFLNHSHTGGLSALTQSGFGYIESNEIEGGGSNSNVGGGSEESDPHSSTKHAWNHLKSSGGSVTSAVRNSETDEKTNVRKKSEIIDNHDNGEKIEAWMKERGARESSKVTRICNPVENIVSKEENVHPPEFKLEALVIVFRHGDRGPLTHIGHRNVSHINCAAKSPDLDSFMKFSTDAISKLPGYSQFIGAFHSFPKVPTNKFCSLGQLTQLGSHQLLTLGKMVRSTYRSTFFEVDSSSFYAAPGSSVTASHTSTNTNHLPFKVLAYSTRYRRTFQSLFAFLFGLLGPKDMFQSATIRESQSITFCFHDCSCRIADKLKKVATKQHKMTSENKAEMNKLVAKLNTILGTGKSKKAGSSLLDSLLVYPCHKMELPCQEDNQKEKGVKSLYKAIQKLSLLQTPQKVSSSCVNLDNLENLVNFIKLENKSLKDSKAHLKYHLLSSYGLLKEIVNVALKMTSGGGSPENKQQQDTNRNYDRKPFYTAPIAASSSLYSSTGTGYGNNNNGFGRKISKKTKILVFSGHDTTLQSLTSALLGLSTEHPDMQLPPFASRIIFEFYRKTTSSPNSPRNHYFRAIFNGVSVTHLITFCKDNSEVSEDKLNNSKIRQSHEFKNEKKTSPKALFMCPVEFLVRFIHDHYFESFGNATNFKDACQL